MVYLYIKTHNITGLQYFGKVTDENIYTYKGSGKYWKRHIKKHGNNVYTTLYAQFKNNDDNIIDVALDFSEENNIVKSKKWANLIPENGLDGMPKGTKHTQKTKDKIAKSKIGKTYGYHHSEETKLKIARTGSSNHRYGIKHSEETKRKISEGGKGKVMSKESIQKGIESRAWYICSKETKYRTSKTLKKLYNRPWKNNNLKHLNLYKDLINLYIIWINNDKPGNNKLAKLYNVDIQIPSVVKYFRAFGNPELDFEYTQWVNQFSIEPPEGDSKRLITLLEL